MPPTTASVRIASFDSRVRNTCHYKKGRDVSVSTPVSEYQCFKYKDSKPVVYLLATLSLRTLKWREGNFFEWEGISSLCKRCINIFIRNSCIHLYLHQKYIHAFQTKIQSKPFQCISCEDILSHSFFFSTFVTMNVVEVKRNLHCIYSRTLTLHTEKGKKEKDVDVAAIRV